MNPQIAFLLNKSIEALRSSNLESADLYLKQAVRLESTNPHVLRLLGVISAQRREYPAALHYLNTSLKILPKNPLTLSALGNIYLHLKEYSSALEVYDKSIKIEPKFEEAWSNKANVLYELKRYEESLVHHDQALILKPDYVAAHSNKGNVLYELKRYEEALIHYDKALALQPDYAEAHYNKGNLLNQLRHYEEALIHYDKAIASKSDYHEAWTNKGTILYELKCYDKAIAHYDKALSYKSDYHEAWTNKGVALFEFKSYDEAIAHYDKALSYKSDYAEAYSNKGNVFNELKRYDEAIAQYDKALILKPDIDWVYGSYIHAKMKMCCWKSFHEEIQTLSDKLLLHKKVSHPFPVLSLIDDAFLHKQSSEIYIKDKHPLDPILGSISKPLKPSKPRRIRIAYVSPDFQNHPVSFLTTELFEIHDRDRFEVFAFSLQKAPIGDETRLRLRNGFDRFIDLENMSDLEIARLARELEIDIAIDLTGHTHSARTGIFSYRAAPIQVNWLGYPGTIGADFIDYIVADKVMIPEIHQQFYTEKVAYLSNTYMVDNSKRIASSRIFTREECGLPEAAFVFCCFNNDYKFNPQVLDRFSRILLGVENSVFWISENNKYFKANITTEFENRGVDPSRIIFAKRLELMADHLARYALADLFLDTYPYSAHTTALDSLKVGVPVVTLMGQSFPSRGAASLLNAAGLPQLITTNQQDYETLAIKLAKTPQSLSIIKQKLSQNCLITPLFDTPVFAQGLEAAYIEMYDRYQAGLLPDHIPSIR